MVHGSWSKRKVAYVQAWFRQLRLLQKAVMVAQTYQSNSEREREWSVPALIEARICCLIVLRAHVRGLQLSFL